MGNRATFVYLFKNIVAIFFTIEVCCIPFSIEGLDKKSALGNRNFVSTDAEMDRLDGSIQCSEERNKYLETLKRNRMGL